MILCPAGSNSYTVRPGDSLWAIAQRFRTTVSAITTANPGLNINNLLIGANALHPQRTHAAVLTVLPQGRAGAARSHGGCCGRSTSTGRGWSYSVWSLTCRIRMPRPPGFSATRSDFKSILKLFYGDGIAGDFAELFASHLALAAELVRAAKAGNPRRGRPTQKRGGIKMQIRSPPSWAVSILTGRPSNGRRCCMTTLQ